MPRMWEWIYLGNSIRSATRSSGRSSSRQTQPVESEREQARRELNEYELTLIRSATSHTKIWVQIEELILIAKENLGNDEALRTLRQNARNQRIDALNTSASNQITISVEPLYQPVWNMIREMQESQIPLFDEIIQACDSRNPSDLDHALATTRYCLSLGEQAILTVPEKNRERLRLEGDARRNKMLIGLLLGLLCFVGCAVCVATY